MAQCTYEVKLKTDRDYKCSREATPNGDRCIFHHAEGITDAVQAQAYIKEELSNAETDVLDLTGANFKDLQGVFVNVTIKREIRFDKATFGNRVEFKNVRFKKECSFAEATFNRGFLFQQVSFADTVSFDDIKAGPRKSCAFEGVSFDGATSWNLATFENPFSIKEFVTETGTIIDTRFTQPTVIKEAEFGRVQLSRVVFEQTLRIDGTRDDAIAPKETVFNDAVTITQADFHQGAHFSNCRFDKGCAFETVTHKRGKFLFDPNSFQGKLSFSGSNLTGHLEFGPHPGADEVEFSDFDMKGVRLLSLHKAEAKAVFKLLATFQNCTWPRTDMFPSKFWSPFLYVPRGRSCVADEFDGPRSQPLLELYRYLHELYYSKSKFDLSSAFYEGFMVTKRKVSEGNRTAKFIDGFYSVFSRYGNSITRPAAALLGMWLIVPLILLVFGLKLQPETPDVTLRQLESLGQYFQAFIINISLSTFMRTDTLRPPLGSIQNAILLLETLLNGFFIGFLALGIRRHFAPKKPV